MGKKDNGSYVRTILKFERLYDVSPVYYPAYEDTTVALRSLIDRKDAEQREIERLAKEKQETEKREFDEYFNNLKNKF